MMIQQSPTRHVRTSSKVVLLSGLSDPRTCALSQIQIDFLRAIKMSADEKLLLNFPYLPEHAGHVQSPSLLAASWANTVQFLQASRNKYRSAATAHWNALVDSCDRLHVITLSCGLEILNGCLVAGRRPGKLQVVALGPVARARPTAPHKLVQGSHDYISKPFFRNTEIVLQGVGHMDYLQHSHTIDVVNEILEQEG